MAPLRAVAVVLLVALLVALPVPLHAQIFDLSAAWGDEERTVDVGLGASIWWVSVVGGIAAVEHGLADSYTWYDEKTRIRARADIGDPPAPIDPRDARTSPYVRPWVRLEVQPGWYGGAVMWDPRRQPALGIFGRLRLTSRSSAIAELRWVRSIGHVLSGRLRWR